MFTIFDTPDKYFFAFKQRNRYDGSLSVIQKYKFLSSYFSLARIQSYIRFINWKVSENECMLNSFFCNAIIKMCLKIAGFVNFIRMDPCKSVPLYSFPRTVKLAYNDHPQDPKFMAVVDRWPLFRGCLIF